MSGNINEIVEVNEGLQSFLCFVYREGVPLLQDAENFTVLIKNTVQFPKFKESKYVLPSINLHILLTVSHIFFMVQLGRICLNIKAFNLW